MECLQSRIDSFTKPKRVKNPTKQLRFVSVKWSHPPHPRFIATPETLAEAGFYFNPSFEDRDNVACFVCDKQLADWEADDDPFDIHWAKCGDRCCWAIVRCGLRGDINRHGGFTFTDKSRVPTSKAMEQARLETFSAGDGWKHDQVKNHGANSRKMARAGFVFTPQYTGDDLATCLYCKVALSGWEASDDPIEEHRKRRKGSCPMFDFVEPATKPPSRPPSGKVPSKSQNSKNIHVDSPLNDADSVQPLKTHDGDTNESNPVPPPSSKRIRTLSSSSKSGKTPKASRSQSHSELKDVAENEEDLEILAEVPRTGRGKAKKSMATAIKKAKSRSKSVAPRTISDDEEVMSKVHSRSRSKAKGKEKVAVDDDEPEEGTKALKKSTRSRPPSRVKESEGEHEVKVLKKSTRGRAPQRVEESENEEQEKHDVNLVRKSTRGRVPPRVKESENEEEEEEQDVKAMKKSTRGRAPPHVGESENEEEEEQDVKFVRKSTRGRAPPRVKESENEEEEEEQNVKVMKKFTRGRAPSRVEESENEEEQEEQNVKVVKKSTKRRVPARVKEPENDDNVSETIKKPIRTKTPSHVEGTTTARKPSRLKKIKEPEPDPESELDPQHDVETEVMDEEERKPRASSESRAEMPVASRPSCARPKTTSVPAEEDQDEERQDTPPSPLSVVEKKKHVLSTSARTSATNADSKVARPTSGRATPAPPGDVDDRDVDNLEEELPAIETKKRVSSSRVFNRPDPSGIKTKGKAAVPIPPLPEEAVDDEDEEDEMDMFVSPRESPGPHVEEEEGPNPKGQASEVDAEMEPLVIPKRGDKPSSFKPTTKPTKAMDEAVDIEFVPAPREPVGKAKPQEPGKETTTKPTRESQSVIKDRKSSFLTVVDISTDEEGGATDEEQPAEKNEGEITQKTVFSSKDAPSSLELKDTAEMATVIVEPPPLPSAEPAPSRKATQPPQSTLPSFTKTSEDVEMAPPEPEPKPEPEPFVDLHAMESVVEVPVPQTPPRAVAPPKPPTPEPPLFVPPLSKLPFKPLHNLTDAELDMTVEEWIRYQMEMEYDKFKRDGEREIGRFKRRAEEVKEIIERL